MSPVGWATGYALSIYGTEYTQQCPFGTGNGYGDGRAISVFEGLFNGERMEMQLKVEVQLPIVEGQMVGPSYVLAFESFCTGIYGCPWNPYLKIFNTLCLTFRIS